MRYVSTRGLAPTVGFGDVLLNGLAPDGGLYVPDRWPRFTPAEIAALRGLPYPELVAAVSAPFVDETIADLRGIAGDAYATFDRLVPLTDLGGGLWLLELFWGPTLAFKDYALQLLGRLFDTSLTERHRRALVLGATSGDTGSAAIEACRDRAALDIVILHPHERISEVQRRQMTTVPSANVHNLAVRGTFDDCQRLVKEMLADPSLRSEFGVTSVNSINWVRIMAQVAYYFAAALTLGAPEREVTFSVPTGNFGNVFAAYVARRMGLPVRRLIIGTNRNNVVARFLETGELSIDTVVPTITPAMDIQVPSNLERLLFDLHDRDGRPIRLLMAAFAEQGWVKVDPTRLEELGSFVTARWFDEPAIRRVLTGIHRETSVLVDPHTAVGIAAARATEREPDVPVICIGTAHPAKFPDAVATATGVRPRLPERLSDLFDRPEIMTVLPADRRVVEGFVRRVVPPGRGEDE
ncbi:MAG: threonine synthase [Acidimicrobiia bacterium]|nr:threonine synthase [Acidimicrobiia bacterium]